MLINLTNIQTWVEGEKVCSDLLLVGGGAGKSWDAYPVAAEQRVTMDSWGRYGVYANHVVGNGYMVDTKVVY